MKLERIINDLKDLKKQFSNGANLKNYCLRKNLSYTSTSRIFSKSFFNLDRPDVKLRTAYGILGLTPERNIPPVVLETKIKDLIEIKKYFEK